MRTISLGRGKRHSWRLLLGETIGTPECPLMRRWVAQTPLGGLRVHHFLRGDADRDPHDHPFSFVTFVLRGGYVDVTPEAREVLRPGAVRYRPAHHVHRVETAGCWTLVLSGPQVHRWGFITPSGRQSMAEYHAINGHPACADMPLPPSSP